MILLKHVDVICFVSTKQVKPHLVLRVRGRLSIQDDGMLSYMELSSFKHHERVDGVHFAA